MRSLLPMALATTLAMSPQPQELTREAVREDFDAFHRFVAVNYAYFDGKAVAWQNVPALYAADLERVRTRRDLLVLLERVVEELYDHHAHPTANTAESPRLVPAGADIWAEWRNDRALVVEVRDGSDAQRGGISAGAVIVAIDGTAVEQAVETRLGRALTRRGDDARSWALRAALAGRRNHSRSITFRKGTIATTIELPAGEQVYPRDGRLAARVLRGNRGYIRIHDALGDRDLIGDFDRALETLRGTRGLILDLRDTPSGGNTTVARAILGRFVKTEMPYQKHALPSETRETGIVRSWLEIVSPRGPFRYARPVAVLVNHWTGSMGEGLAIGFDATRAGIVIGTPMAGLLGATYRYDLPHARFGINVPAEKLFHVDGTPRESFVPPVAVDPAQARDGVDPWIAAAERALSR